MAETKARLAGLYGEVLLFQKELSAKAATVRRQFREETGKPLANSDLRVFIPNSTYVRTHLKEKPSLDVKYYDFSFEEVSEAVSRFKAALILSLRFKRVLSGEYEDIMPDELGRRMQKRVENFVEHRDSQSTNIPPLAVASSPFLKEVERTPDALKDHIFWLTTWEEYLRFHMEELKVGSKDGLLLSFQAPKFVGRYKIQWMTKHLATACEFVESIREIRQRFERDLEAQEPEALLEVRSQVQQYRKENYLIDEDGNVMGLPQPRVQLDRLQNLPDMLALVADHKRKFKQNE